jgi:hypothetical protein
MRKAIGIFQLVTGLFGIIILVFNAFALGVEVYNQNAFMLQLFLGVFLYGSLAWAGYSLINNYKKAFRMSVSIQLIQIPAFAIEGLYYKFSASAFLFAGYGKEFFFKAGLKPIDYALSANQMNEHFFGIYIFPLVLFIILIISRKK